MTFLKYTVVPTHIDLIKAGDVVVVQGELKTVCPKDLKRHSGLGTTLWGDSYKCGTVPVARADIYHARPNLESHHD